jgi:hypothetical protein
VDGSERAAIVSQAVLTPIGPTAPVAERRWVRLVPLLPVVLLPAVWALLLSTGPAIGHDEAVYANRARALVTDLPAAGWEVYRPPGLAWLGAPVLAAGGGLTGLRVLALGFAAAALGLLFAVLRRWSGRVTGTVAVLVVLSAGTVLRRLPEYLNDLLGAGMLLAVLALLIGVRRGGHPVRLPVAAAVAVAAFYVRYGVVSSFAALGLAVLLVYGVRVWWRDRLWLALAAGLGVAGLLPHLLWARAATGSPTGALAAAGEVAGRVPLGSGLRWYLGALASGRLAGIPATLVMLAGLVGAARVTLAVRRARNGGRPPLDGVPDERWMPVLVLAGMLQLVVLGIPAHPEPRYVFFAVLALVAAGAHTLFRAAGRHERMLAALVGLAVLAVLAATAVQYARERRYADGLVVLARAGRAAGGQHPCVVVGRQRPELGWYSGCRDLPLDATLDGELEAVPAQVPVHLVRFEGDRRPDDGTAALARRGPVVSLLIEGRGRLGDAHVESVPGGAR